MLGRLEVPRHLVVPHLEEMLADLDPNADAALDRVVCRSQIGWGPPAAVAVETLYHQLKDQQSIIRREEMLYQLGQFGVEAESALVALLGCGPIEEENIIYEAVTRFVPPSPSTIAALLRCLSDDDDLNRPYIHALRQIDPKARLARVRLLDWKRNRQLEFRERLPAIDAAFYKNFGEPIE